MSDISSGKNNFQPILNQWNTDKNDNGLTLKEIKTAADSNNDGKITLNELNVKGISGKTADHILNKIENINFSDKFFSNIGIKSDPNNKTVLKLIELDKEAMPGGIENISVSDIQQGNRATCYFQAALASLVAARPDDILNLIDKNKDGTYTVTFPGLPETKNVPVVNPLSSLMLAIPAVTIKNANRVTVEAPTKKELEKYTHAGKNDSKWAAILDKAFNKYFADFGLKTNTIPFFPKDKASEWGLPWEGIEALTGNKAEHFTIPFYDNKTLMDKIKNSLADKKIITACTIFKGDASPEVGKPRISNKHVYPVLSVDEKNQTITVRDNYGAVFYRESENQKKKEDMRKDTSTDGFMTLSISKFREYFMDMAFETDQKIN